MSKLHTFRWISTITILAMLLAAFGFSAPSAFAIGGSSVIVDQVWEDLDVDGIREQFTGGEPDFPGVTVRLYTCAGLLVGEQATNVSGNAAFFDLPAGDYFVEFIAPIGYAFTLQDQGTNDDADSDADPLTGRTVCFYLAAGAQEKSFDAGLYKLQTPVLASLGDFVWHDLNANGVQDAGELGVESVTVHLLDCAGNILATTTTNASGFYLFSGLMPGNYNVQFVLPSGYAFSPQDVGDDLFDSDADSMGFTSCTTLEPGENDLSWDAGIFMRASLGDFVWYDLDKDGVQDAGEQGVENVTVRLLDCAGNELAIAATGPSGFYLFSSLMPGNYNVQFLLPSGYAFSPQDVNDDLFDSDAGAFGVTACTTLTSGENDLSWDAGIYMMQVGPGTGTPGYWKNHPEAWPVESITIGGVVYTKAQAIFWMSQKDGDKTVTLFRALVSAKLNVLIGNDTSCIASTISAADNWFMAYGPVGSGVKADSLAWKIGEPLYLQLDLYNNGGLCAPHRD